MTENERSLKGKWRLGFKTGEETSLEKTSLGQEDRGKKGPHKRGSYDKVK